ncbi:MAG: hypothetical protein ACREQ2_27475 [Candidatus Binatia bacterium]
MKRVSFITGFLILRASISFCAPPVASPSAQALDVVRAYLRATHARDFRSAYNYISSADQKIRDEETYVKSQESFDGFALELARKLAADLQVRVIEHDASTAKTRLEVAYQVPTGDEISGQLFDWNRSKLNALPPSAQQRLAGALDDVKKQGKMTSLEGRQTFRLVREKNGWKIFLDWASRARVIFKSLVPRTGELEVQFARNDFLVAMNDPFQIDFTLKNRSARPIVARLNHLIEPRRFADNVEMIACGSLAPARLDPGEIREAFSSYILGGVSAKSRLSIVYEFSVAPQKTEKKTISRHATSR